MRRMIQLIENETFTNEAISLDDVVYVNCRFVDCATVIKSRPDACSVIINSVSVGDPGKSGDLLKALDTAKHTPLPFSGEQNFCINGSLEKLQRLGWKTFDECGLVEVNGTSHSSGPSCKVVDGVNGEPTVIWQDGMGEIRITHRESGDVPLTE